MYHLISNRWESILTTHKLSECEVTESLSEIFLREAVFENIWHEFHLLIKRWMGYVMKSRRSVIFYDAMYRFMTYWKITTQTFDDFEKMISEVNLDISRSNLIACVRDFPDDVRHLCVFIIVLSRQNITKPEYKVGQMIRNNPLLREWSWVPCLANVLSVYDSLVHATL